MTKIKRDLTEAQFLAKCAKEGFEPTGFLEYFHVANGWGLVPVNHLPRRRDKLDCLRKVNMTELAYRARIDAERKAK